MFLSKLVFDDEEDVPEEEHLVDPPGNYDPELLYPTLRERLRKAHNRFPLWVASGHRSSQEQEYLYNQYLNGSGNPANPPGTSNHEAVPYGEPMSLAVDIHPAEGSDYQTMQRIGGEEGLIFPITTELWHAQPSEVTSGKWVGLPN